MVQPVSLPDMGPIATDRLKFCTERGRLLDYLSNAARDYGRAATHLGSKLETMSEADYKRVRAETEAARLDAEQAREALLQHRREHGCWKSSNKILFLAPPM